MTDTPPPNDQPTVSGPTPEAPGTPPYPTPILPAKKKNTVGLIAIILAIIGFLFACIPGVLVVGWLLLPPAFILGIVGVCLSGRKKGTSIAAIIIAVVGTIVGFLVFTSLFVNAVSNALASGDAAASRATSGTSSLSADSDSQDDSSTTGASFTNNVLTTEDFKIEITKYKIIDAGDKGNEYGSKPVIAFWYKITNISGKELTPMDWIYYFDAYQDNDPNSLNKLDVGSLPDDRYLGTQLETIKKGGTVKNAMAYELDDTKTPVDLVAFENSFSGTEIGRISFKVK